MNETIVEATGPPHARAETSDPRFERLAGWLALVVCLAPAIAAVAWFPGFTTQDGPSHLYNAQIVLDALRGGGVFGSVYEVRWQPLPNWLGHLGLAGLLAIFRPDVADRLMTVLTLVAPSASLLWLRDRVAGPRGLAMAAPLIVLLNLNLCWLFGFSSFLLGTSLLAATLAVWCRAIGSPSPRGTILVAVLLILGYFAHLISLGLTLIGIVVVAAATPGLGRGRLVRTVAAIAPVLPLLVIYRRIMRAGGGIEPIWNHFRSPWELASWKDQLAWVDPLSIAPRLVPPWSDEAWRGFTVIAPPTLLGLGLIALAAGAIGSGQDLARRRGWAVLAGLLLAGGVLAPDTLGPQHGNYLPQRIVLIGLMVGVTVLPIEPSRLASRIGVIAITGALAVQSAYVFDHAARSQRLTAPMREAARLVRPGERAAGLQLELRQKFRANPLLHADCLLGVGNGAIVWSNYETAQYYFPVRVRDGVPHPPPLAFELVAVRDDPADSAERADDWRQLLERHANEVDVLMIGGEGPPNLRAITGRFYREEQRLGPLRLLRRRDDVAGSRPSAPSGVP
jgi:hypothetical protein